MVSSYLETAHRETVECRRRTTAYLSRSSGVESAMTGSTGGAIMDAESRKMAMNARDQIGRYRDQVHTSVRPIAQRIAMQPFRLAKIAKAPGKRSAETRLYNRKECHELLSRNFGLKSGDDFEIVDQHPILDRLNRPSDSMPWLTGQAIKAALITSLECAGYGCWWMPKGREVVYLPPHWVRPVTDARGLFQEWLLKADGQQDDIHVPAEDMAYFVYLDPSNPMKALGPLEAGIRTVMVQEYVQEALKRAFQLGIHPSMIVKVAAGQTPDGKPIRRRLKKWQMDQIRESVMQRLRGPMNYGMPWFIDALIEDIQPYGNMPKDMDFGMNADKTQAQVEQTFGTNPYIAGAAGLGSRAESGEAERHFVRTVVNPKIELVSHTLSWSVGPRLGAKGYILFIEPARPDDSEMESNDWKQAQVYPCVTVNDVRVNRLNLAPVPWGDAVWNAKTGALITEDQLVGGYSPPVASGASGGALPKPDKSETHPVAGESEEEGNEPADQDDEEAGKAHRPFDRSASKAFDATFYADFSAKWLKVQGANEDALTAALMPLFKQQAASVGKKYKALKGEQTDADSIAAKIFNPGEWADKLKAAVTTGLSKAMSAGAVHEWNAFQPMARHVNVQTKATGDLEFDFGVDFPKTIIEGIEAALTHTMAQDYWSGILQTQRDDLASALHSAIKEGKEPREIAKDVREVFDGAIGKRRAARIARTESTWSVSRGQQLAREELHEQGIVDGKELMATYDTRTRATHIAADGQTRAVDEDFDIGGFPAQCPGDPRLPARERINCRCHAASTTVYTERGVRPVLKCEGHGKAATAWPYATKGGPGSGPHPHGGSRKVKKERAKKAKATHKPSTKAKQDHAEANEHVVSKKLGAKKSPDNAAMDVTIEHGGKLNHGVELKTMLDNKNDKITMHPPSRRRKEAWAKEHKATIHTVVLDHRDRFNNGENKDQHSGHEIYYKRGVGAFRVGTMYKAKDWAEVKKLMDMPHDKLPAGAKDFDV